MTEPHQSGEERTEHVSGTSHRQIRVPLVWIVPILAALLGAWLLFRSISDRGTQIQITFQTADGIEAGKTAIRYRSVDIGIVRSIALAPDFKGAIINAEMKKGIEATLVSDTRFWVVRPQIATGGISGLGTLLTGAYIGMDIGRATVPRREFSGLESPPSVSSDTPGREFVLHAKTLGSIAVGSLAYFRRLAVGEITKCELDQDGNGVTISVFIRAPYDSFVVPNTRFWNASGIDVAIDGGGVRIQTQSVASILEGGIAFETPQEFAGAAPAAALSEFLLSADRDTAMKSPNEPADRYVLYFNESLRGLSVGAPVNFNGIDVGDVQSINIEFDTNKSTFRFPVEINVHPQRIRARYKHPGAMPDTKSTGTYRFVERLIEHGFRGQLRSSSLLTGQQFIALDFFANQPTLRSDPTKTPMQIPTIVGGMVDITSTVADIARKIDAVPIDVLAKHADSAIQELDRALVSLNRAIEHLDSDVTPQFASALKAARSGIEGATKALSPDSPVQQDLGEALRQIARASESIKVLADYLEAHPESLIRGKSEEGR